MKFWKTFLAALLAVVAGGLFSFLFWFFLLLGIAGSLERSAPVVKPGSVLCIDFADLISDSPVSDPIASIDFDTFETVRRLPLLQTLRAIESAATDPRIDGIYLRFGGAGGVEGMALLEELRSALVDFRHTSGKFVVAYNESYTQGLYYLATAADRIYIQPEGSMEWRGLAMHTLFYKGLFDKLDLRAEVFRPTACRYKSAVEPYLLTGMSEANREQMQALADSMWETILAAVSEARGIAPAELERLADGLEVMLPEEAFRHGLVDGVLYEDGMRNVLAMLADRPQTEEFPPFVSLGDYAMQILPDAARLSDPEIAVVYADGAIVDGATGRYGEVCGKELADLLDEVRCDDRVKGVVLRVNSPGGSALASDVIWRAMELLRAEKPVVVSMGSYAASGGYYISCPADVVVADRLTLTGSIGVFGMYVDTRDALRNKLGITIDGVKTNRSADLGVGPLSASERNALMRGVDKVYDTFTRHVAEGRNLPLDRVLDIAGGRVWSGADALGIGLTDATGGLREAIALAADKAELKGSYRVVEVVKTPDTFAAFFSSLFMRAKTLFASSELGMLMREYRKVQEAVGQRGVVMYEPRSFIIE